MRPLVLPPGARKAIALLNASGFEAVAVGGCVRDSLLGKAPEDWDIATSARPEQAKSVFADYRMIDTGLKHGTLTVLIDGAAYEITSYRVDGVYSDRRRPDSVSYTDSLREDLARRDFTVNAMAYHPDKGLVDPFGGLRDIESRLLRCVGEPGLRFGEDALRIMRAARFSATLGFAVEEQTALAMGEMCGLLSDVSAERLAAELNKALLGDWAEQALVAHGYLFAGILPEIKPSLGFCQHTKYHHLDVWRHSAKSVAAAPRDLTVRIAMLFHDTGKPNTFTLQKPGEGHFYGHGAVSAKLAEEALSRLKYDSRTLKDAVYLVKHHCDEISMEPKAIKRLLNRMGEPLLRKLLAVNVADCMAQASEFALKRVEHFKGIERVLDTIIAENQAFSLKDLAVGGHDLLEAGFVPGKRLGGALSFLLEQVLDEKLPNEKTALLSAAKELL